MTSEILQILMSPDNPHFRLSTFGHAGSTHVSLGTNDGERLKKYKYDWWVSGSQKICVEFHMSRSLVFLCGLHKVCGHITARSDLFICPRESSACHVF